MAHSKGWTCQRQRNGVKCAHHNAPRTRKCQACGKPRPQRREPAHRAALKLDYATYLAINGGIEQCGICGAPPTPTRRLDRDHEHNGNGRPRGLLCRRCNRLLTRYHTDDWLRAALAYLERTLKCPTSIQSAEARSTKVSKRRSTASKPPAT